MMDIEAVRLLLAKLWESACSRGMIIDHVWDQGRPCLCADGRLHGCGKDVGSGGRGSGAPAAAVHVGLVGRVVL